MMISLKNKVAIITGASRGIGRATAILFAQAGCKILINYHKNEKTALAVKSNAEKFNITAKIFQADMSKKTDVDKMIKFAVEQFGKIDILINNAGIWKYAEIDKMAEKQLKETMELNVNGIFYATTATVPYMIKQKSGNIINISSTAGQRGEPLHSHYAASKGALISLTKSLAAELAVHNIRVNCVAPGWVDTDMSHESLTGDKREEILDTIPLRRAAQPEEIAGAILFLASDLSTYITGEILNVNGGSVLCG